MKKLLALCLLVSSSAFADERIDRGHVYRFDFVVAESDAGKTTTSTAYTLNLEEKHSGEIKIGTNVALSPTTRADIGLWLRTNFITVGEDLLIDDDVELSAVKDAQTFRKLSTKGNALVTPGKPALIASLEDPLTRKHYQVMLTATKLR